MPDAGRSVVFCLFSLTQSPWEAVQHPLYGGSAGPALAVSEAVSRLSLGCQSCVSVSRLQSADMSLDLTGPGTPTPNSLERITGLASPRVYLYGMTDNILAGLLPALPPAAHRYDWTYLLIAGEEERRHHRLTMTM